MFIQQQGYYSITSDHPVRVYGHASKAIDWSKDWPEKTSILCWHCCHSFDTRPIPFPVSYDRNRNAFQVVGVFCGWACVKAFNRDCRPIATQSIDAMIISLFHKRCTGKIEKITPAPPKIVLEAFGGHLSIDEYRAASRDGVTYEILPPKMILRSQVLHEHRLQDAREREKAALKNDLTTVVNLTTSRAATTVEKSTELKLRRPKQTNARKQSLFEKIVMAANADKSASTPINPQ